MALGSDQPIMIKKVKKVVGGGHHGGAWKVAYADFVTAMMAFFLLMWLINTTSPEQKRGIADYFAPASVAETTSGSGGILGGTALGEDGAKSAGSMSSVEQMNPESPSESDATGQSETTGGAGSLESASEAALRRELQAREDAAFASAAQSLRQALQDMPELAELSKQILIDQTPEGLRIQLVDQEGRSMFKDGAAMPNDRSRILLRAVSRIINQLPNRLTQGGDWALSSARADVARQLLQSFGVDPDRVYQVSGKANSDPLFPDDPMLAGNRRISIILLREAPVLPPDR